MATKKVRLEDITVDMTIHFRDKVDQGAVARYMECLDNLPPVKLVRVEGQWLLASGLHRYDAHRNAGRDEIEAETIEGTRNKAIIIGLKDNALHGVPLNRKERNRAIVMLADEDLPHREIGEIFGLGDDAVGVIARKAGRRRRDASINEKGKETREANGQDPKLSGPTTPEETWEPGESIPTAHGAASHQPESQETADNGATVDVAPMPEYAAPFHQSPMAGFNGNPSETFMIDLLPSHWIGLVNAAEASPYLEQDELAVAAVRLLKERLVSFGIPWERVDDATLEDVDPLPITDEKSATEEGGLADQPALSEEACEATEGTP